jgi:hypothetical protein
MHENRTFLFVESFDNRRKMVRKAKPCFIITEARLGIDTSDCMPNSSSWALFFITFNRPHTRRK